MSTKLLSYKPVFSTSDVLPFCYDLTCYRLDWTRQESTNTGLKLRGDHGRFQLRLAHTRLMKTQDTKYMPTQIYISIKSETIAHYSGVNFFLSVPIDWYSASSQVLLDKLCSSPRTNIPVKAVLAFYCLPSSISQRNIVINLVRVKFLKRNHFIRPRKHFRFWYFFWDSLVTL